MPAHLDGFARRLARHPCRRAAQLHLFLARLHRPQPLAADGDREHGLADGVVNGGVAVHREGACVGLVEAHKVGEVHEDAAQRNLRSGVGLCGGVTGRGACRRDGKRCMQA
eukprot:51892-Chlamydomonas_euryale.AAC.1